jgi:hypothetical protein
MNCVHCDYLLWNLPENRCPECGHDFEVTDFAFPAGRVEFLCRHCGQGYFGNDDRGLPAPRRFTCVSCQNALDAADMTVRPDGDGVIGEALNFGTPWQHRRRVGFVRGFIDAVARLAITPGEYFRLAAANNSDGSLAFSVLCAYVALVAFAAMLYLFHSTGLAAWMPDPLKLMKSPALVILLVAVPFVQIAWNYLYGLLIQAVLMGLGHQRGQLDASVRAVALGSAVLPAILLLPPVGLFWYLCVVCSGIENLHATSRAKALTATLIPMLIALNVALGAWYFVS